MSEGMVQPVLIDRIRDVVGRCFGFLTAAAHRNADGAVLKLSLIHIWMSAALYPKA